MKFTGPDFIIVGSQKCGTSSLFHYLSQHVQIIPSRIKEVHYFDLNYSKGDEWYHDFFPTWKEKIFLSIKERKKVITGEASPYYIFHPSAVERIYKYSSDIKIIVLLRNPTERAWSHFRHNKRKGREHNTFSEALNLENQRIFNGCDEKDYENVNHTFGYQHYSYCKRGEYFSQIERLFKFFNRKNVLILESEMFFSDTQKVMDEVCGFLKIQKVDREYKIVNKGDKKTIDPKIKNRLQRHFQPYNERLYQLIGKKFNW